MVGLGEASSPPGAELAVDVTPARPAQKKRVAGSACLPAQTTRPDSYLSTYPPGGTQ
jgi:hypothetical protein